MWYSLDATHGPTEIAYWEYREIVHAQSVLNDLFPLFIEQKTKILMSPII